MRKIEKLVLATHNKGKVKEIGDLLAPYDITVADAGTLGLAEPEETGSTFAENAVLKAMLAAHTTMLPALADDSGMAVTGLNGNPGIFSARWAGPEKDFNMAMEKVNDALGDHPDRSAAFICVLALAWPNGDCEIFEGRIDGTVVWPPRGKGGFGYDPMFLPDGSDYTYGEMTMEEKKRDSHRSRAFGKLTAHLAKK